MAPAKINLALHVTARRPDGYHDLDTLVVFADFGDRLSVSPAGELALHVSGPFADHAPAGPENLVFKVAAELRSLCRIDTGASISLVKNLPAGAGIGGGSADAAAALKALNDLWQTGLGPADLADIGIRFGSDIPMCLQSSALRTTDTPKRMVPWQNAPPLPLVLVWPARAVSTGGVFATLQSTANPPMPDIDLADLDRSDRVIEFLRRTRNDMTEAATAIEPAIADALQALESQPACLLNRMSGSGSACFGIFADIGQAEAAAAEIAGRHGDWWVRAVTTR
jgi:4-diphosphocytidyl-2-C-methyl-D-erythritol kinase